MKHVKNAAIGVSLFSSLSAGVQQNIVELNNTPKQEKVVSGDNPFKKRNKDAKSVHWRKGNVMKIEKRDGTIEIYDLDEAKAQKKAEQLYGVLPPAPPPPPKIDISKFSAPPPPPTLAPPTKKNRAS